MVHVLVEAAWVNYFNMMVHCTRTGVCRNCFVDITFLKSDPAPSPNLEQ